jgi:hypothetical protein
MNRNVFRSTTMNTPSAPGAQISLGTFPTYDQAQRVVDTLADNQFEVETTQIIGSNLRLVEQVTGRLTWPRAVLSGVAKGIWFGVFVGLLISILGTTTLLGAIAWGVSWGALFWGAFGAIDYAMTGGRRDFTSLSETVPSTYEVLVAATHGERARSVLAAVAV